MESSINTLLMEKRNSVLSLGVILKDDFTGARPIGRINVYIKEIATMENGKPGFLKGILNSSGYYVFPDLPPGSYTPQVESDYYFSQYTTVNDPEYAFIKIITLKPRPDYPFPAQSTLIRGMVKQAADNTPAVGAVVEVTGKGIENLTTEKGEFVLYFKALKETDIIKENGKRYVKGTTGKTIQLRASLDSRAAVSTITEGVEEMKTTCLESPMLLT